MGRQKVTQKARKGEQRKIRRDEDDKIVKGTKENSRPETSQKKISKTRVKRYAAGVNPWPFHC